MELLSPNFLAHVDISKEDIQKNAPLLRNWSTISLNYTKVSEDELEKIILLEINYKCRKSILDRLVTRLLKVKKSNYISQIADEFNGNPPSKTRKPKHTPIYKMIDGSA